MRPSGVTELRQQCKALRIRVKVLEKDLHQEKEYTSNLMKRCNEMKVRVEALERGLRQEKIHSTTLLNAVNGVMSRIEEISKRTDSMHFDTDVPGRGELDYEQMEDS